MLAQWLISISNYRHYGVLSSSNGARDCSNQARRRDPWHEPGWSASSTISARDLRANTSRRWPSAISETSRTSWASSTRRQMAMHSPDEITESRWQAPEWIAVGRMTDSSNYSAYLGPLHIHFALITSMTVLTVQITFISLHFLLIYVHFALQLLLYAFISVPFYFHWGQISSLTVLIVQFTFILLHFLLICVHFAVHLLLYASNSVYFTSKLLRSHHWQS